MSKFVSYDKDKDEIVFVRESKVTDSYIEICLPRATVFQFLLDMCARFGDDFAVFKSKEPGAPGEGVVEEDTEMVFLSPPTSQCVFEGEEE